MKGWVSKEIMGELFYVCRCLMHKCQSLPIAFHSAQLEALVMLSIRCWG